MRKKQHRVAPKRSRVIKNAWRKEFSMEGQERELRIEISRLNLSNMALVELIDSGSTSSEEKGEMGLQLTAQRKEQGKLREKVALYRSMAKGTSLKQFAKTHALGEGWLSSKQAQK